MDYIPYEPDAGIEYDPNMAAAMALGFGGAGLTGMVMSNALKGEVRKQFAPVKSSISKLKALMAKAPKHAPMAAGLAALLGGGYLLKKKLSD